jgi:hypothetical protein
MKILNKISKRLSSILCGILIVYVLGTSLLHNDLFAYPDSIEATIIIFVLIIYFLSKPFHILFEHRGIMEYCTATESANSYMLSSIPNQSSCMLSSRPNQI